MLEESMGSRRKSMMAHFPGSIPRGVIIVQLTPPGKLNLLLRNMISLCAYAAVLQRTAVAFCASDLQM